MKFLCLGHLDVAAFDRLSEEERNAVLARCGELCEVFRASGKVWMEESLTHPREARTVRAPGTVGDGPYRDSEVQIGAFFILEADSMEEAVAVAKLHPAAILGPEYGFGLELRQIE